MNLEKITLQTVEASRKAASFIRKELETFDDSKIELKEFNNLVSYVDKTSEEILVTELKKILPEADFITEEGSATEQGEELKWVIDPLDGTTNFSHKLPVFSTSVGLLKGKEIIVGVVLEVNRDECFYAWKDGGAFCNGKKISVSKHTELNQTLLATGFPYYMFDKLDAYMEILKTFMQNTHGLRRMGSAAVDLCYVANGIFDGFFEFNLNSYDVAGGAIIVKEAGGLVSTFGGGDDFVFGREIIAASPLIHKAMLEVIQKEWNLTP